MSSNKLQNKLIGAFIFTTFSISILYGVFVFNAMKYTEDDILNRRVELEAKHYIDQYTDNKSTAKLPSSIGISSYLSTSPDFPEWLKNEPLGIRELHDKEVHVGVKQLPDSSELLYITVSELDLSSMEQETSSLLMILVFVGAIITFIGLLIGVVLSKHISTPLIELATEVENSDEKNRLPFSSFERSDEVGTLSRAFTQSVQRSREFLEREKQFTRYASHELRTPIALIRNSLAILNLPDQTQEQQKRNLDRIENAALDMESLIKTFLLLGREKNTTFIESVDISALLRDCLETNQYLNPDKKINIRLDIDEAVLIQCDSSLTSILLDNLLRNVFQYCSANAHIKLTKQYLIIENDTEEHKKKESGQTDSYGMKIVEKISELSQFSVTTKTLPNNFKVTLQFS